MSESKQDIRWPLGGVAPPAGGGPNPAVRAGLSIQSSFLTATEAFWVSSQVSVGSGGVGASCHGLCLYGFISGPFGLQPASLLSHSRSDSGTSHLTCRRFIPETCGRLQLSCCQTDSQCKCPERVGVPACEPICARARRVAWFSL